MTEEKDKTETKLSRRSLIKGLAASAVVGTVGGAALLTQREATAAVPAEATGSSLTTPGAVYPLKYTTDVVVIGGGMGGCCAAVSAAQEGMNVILLEISQKTGGSAAYSGAEIHDFGLGNWTEYLAFTEGLANPVLAHYYVDTLHNTFIPWLNAIGAYFQVFAAFPAGYFVPNTTGLTWQLGHGEPGDMGHRKFFDSLENAFTGFGGGPILLKTRGLKLLTDKYGNLAGVRASTWVNSPKEQNQYTFDIATKTVILTTGSFQWNRELFQKYVGSNAERVYVYGGPYQRGDGLLMAQELGAQLSSSFSTFCGGWAAVTPTPQTEGDPDAYEAALASALPTMQNLGTAVGVGRVSAPGWVASSWRSYTASYGILVNLDGNRFIDENSQLDSKGVARPAQALLRQRQGQGFLIADKGVHDAVASSDSAMSAITAAGGTVFQANAIQDLANAIAAVHPFYPANFLTTITNYNAAIDAGTTALLNPPRTILPTTQEKNGGLYKISTPPFYAVLIAPAIFDSFGGVKINTSSEVLDSQDRPIPGLYAGSTCAGGVMDTIYTGDIASCGVFGFTAGKSAASYVKSGITPPPNTTTTTTSSTSSTTTATTSTTSTTSH